MVKKDKMAGSVVAAAFIGAFASRWIDKALSNKFPFDVILLIVSGVILYFITYKIAGDII